MVDKSCLGPELLDPEAPLALIHLVPLQIELVFHSEAAAEVFERKRG